MHVPVYTCIYLFCASFALTPNDCTVLVHHSKGSVEEQQGQWKRMGVLDTFFRHSNQSIEV